jgi:ABC-type Fe3+/spermidine/putrescine transport system ATPase subunit
MHGVAIHKRDVGMVFQDYALFPHLSVSDNIAFGLKMHRVPTATMSTKVERALQLTRLADLPGIAQRYPHQLSGGQRQRVALARSLVTEPKVLLLDEPFGALDKKLRESMQVELRLLQQQLQITTIFVTHDQEEALTLADRVAVMRDGHLEQLGTPRQVYETPRSRFVADFIGVSNFFQGTVAQEHQGCCMVRTASGMPVWLKPPPERQVRQGETLHLALRPERVRMLPPPADITVSRNTHVATITHVVYLGGMTHYYTRTEYREDFIVYVQNHGTANSQPAFTRGETVALSWQPEHVLLLEEH